MRPILPARCAATASRRRLPCSARRPRRKRSRRRWRFRRPASSSPACRSIGPPSSPGEVAEASRAVAALARSARRRYRSSQQSGACRGRALSRRRSSASAIPARDLVAGGPRRPAARRTSSGARRCSRVAMRAADALVAPTAAFAQTTADAYGIPAAARRAQRPACRGAPPSRPSRHPSCSPPAGCGTRARILRLSTAPRRASTSRCWRPGPSRGRTAP